MYYTGNGGFTGTRMPVVNHAAVQPTGASVFDAAGRLVFANSTIDASALTMHLNKFPAGAYLVRLGAGHGVVRRVAVTSSFVNMVNFSEK